MNVNEALKEIMNEILDEDIIIASNSICKEIYHFKDRPRNFYVMKSGGSSLGIGIGICLYKPDVDIHVITDNKEILENLSTLFLMNKLCLKNLTLYILNDNSSNTNHIKFGEIANCEVIDIDKNCNNILDIKLSPKEIEERFYDSINRSD